MNTSVILRFGLLLGMVNIASLLMAYMVDLTWMVSGWNSMISIILAFAAMFMACLEDRRVLGGSYEYGRAVMTAACTGVVGSLLGIAFTGILYNVIDPNLHVQVKEIMMIKLQSFLDFFGIDDVAAEKAVEAFEKRDFKQDFRALGTAALLSVVMNLLFGLIVGIFVRRKPDNPFET
ncbi:MAG: DUF4199 domain-containing protein [Sphingomonadales bacterium]|nr:DUF4199 domain-containing protein [Sphingomonadales bacterium]